MSLSGWIFLVFSWEVILGLTAYCFMRILKKKTV